MIVEFIIDDDITFKFGRFVIKIGSETERVIDFHCRKRRRRENNTGESFFSHSHDSTQKMLLPVLYSVERGTENDHKSLLVVLRSPLISVSLA
jgi:hypothetical protein